MGKKVNRPRTIIYLLALFTISTPILAQQLVKSIYNSGLTENSAFGEEINAAGFVSGI